MHQETGCLQKLEAILQTLSIALKTACIQEEVEVVRSFSLIFFVLVEDDAIVDPVAEEAAEEVVQEVDTSGLSHKSLARQLCCNAMIHVN